MKPKRNIRKTKTRRDKKEKKKERRKKQVTKILAHGSLISMQSYLEPNL
jgi:hypothetical protein